MEIKRIKVEVEFDDIKPFEYFEYKNKLYLKLPELTCTVKQYISPSRIRDVRGDFNTIKVNDFDLAEYEKFEGSKMVRPLKSELKIYE
jgi:hypothetical protein